MLFYGVFSITNPAQLRGLRLGYASVTPETRVVTRVTPKILARAREHIRAVTHTKNVTNTKNNSFTDQNKWRNRVTHVTTGILGVTDGVTNAFTRNYDLLLPTPLSRKKNAGNLKKGVGMGKEEVRRLFPYCCAIADEYRRVFGEDIKLVYVSESGRELGKRGEPGVKTALSGNVGDV